MKSMISNCFKFTLLVLISMSAHGQGVLESLQSINQSNYHELQSAALGRPLHIVVKPPASYSKKKHKKYPVIYLLDGGMTLPMLAGYYNYLRSQDVLPESIIVAISYASNTFEGGNYRSTDYTAPSEERAYYGGASVFQAVIEQELLPLIESTYRADPKMRIIFGQSIGGQFVLYTALTRPDLFWGHIASNPALHRNLEFFLQRHSDQASSDSRLFVASASNDERRFRRPALAWIDHWTQKANLPWELKAITIEGYGHFSLVTESFRQGLVWVFE